MLLWVVLDLEGVQDLLESIAFCSVRLSLFDGWLTGLLRGVTSGHVCLELGLQIASVGWRCCC